MNQDIKKKWVDALLSGKYKQGKDFLQHDGKYCCLGVLYKEKYGEEPGQWWPEGFVSTDTGLEVDEMNQLASMNDAGVPFEMIAGLIQETL